LNARYYDSITARFLSEDSCRGSNADPLSLNLYTYCYHNPIIYIDPTGHIVTDWDKANCTPAEIAVIQAATIAWTIANAFGNTAGMEAARAAAAAARSGHLSSDAYVDSSGYVVGGAGVDGISWTTGTASPSSSVSLLPVITVNTQKNTKDVNVFIGDMRIGDAALINGSTYANAEQMARALGYNVSKTDDGFIVLTYGSYSYSSNIKQNGNYVVPVRSVVTGRGYDDDLSWWSDEYSGFNVVVRPEMENAAVKVIREGNNVNITAYVNFTGNADDLFVDPNAGTTKFTYAEAAAYGIQYYWSNGGISKLCRLMPILKAIHMQDLDKRNKEEKTKKKRRAMIKSGKKILISVKSRPKNIPPEKTTENIN